MKVLRTKDKKYFIKLIIILFVYICLINYFTYFFGTKVIAEESEAETLSQGTTEVLPKATENLQQNGVKVQLFEDSVTIDLPRNNTAYWFKIPEGSVVGGGSFLNLNMSISSTLIKERSSITLLVNGTTIETKWIYDNISQNAQGWWQVPVPNSLLKIGGVNKLEISTAQRSIEGDCADIDNPSNWVRFDPDSYFYLDLVQSPQATLGNLYPLFYDSLNERFSIETEYVLPQIPKIADVEDVLKVSSAIGAYGSSKSILKNQVSLGNPSSSIKNKIYMGTIDRWLNSPQLLLPDPLEESSGFISVKDNTVLITGQDEIGFKKAADFFANIDYLSQIAEQKVIVNSESQESKAKEFASNESGYYQLTDFGFEDISLNGAFHQSTTFSLKQPNGLIGGNDSYINIKFNHSKALLSDNSLITVYLDDVAYGSEKLSTSNADGGNVKVKIPEDVLNDEVIKVRIDIYNYIGKIDCSKDFSDTAWTVIGKDSEIYFEPTSTGIYPTLNNFPYLSSDKIVMGIDSNYNTDTLNLMSILSTKVGQRTDEASNYSVRTSLDELTHDDKQKDMFFIGTYENLWLPDEVKEELEIVPEKDSFRINENIEATNETLQEKIILQVIRSPWNFNKKIYVITYDKRSENKALEFMSDSKNLDKLGDQISIVNKSGDVVNCKSGISDNLKDNKAPLTFESVKYTVEKATGLPLWFVFAAFTLIGINLFVLVKVVKKKNRFEQAAKDMGSAFEEDINVEEDGSDFEKESSNDVDNDLSLKNDSEINE